MKKLLYSVAVAALVLVASCAREIAPVAVSESDFANVNIALSLGQATKAGDGAQATALQMGVYDITADAPVFMQDLSLLGDNAETLVGGKATISLRLVKGQAYRFVFWAQDPASDAYTATITANGATVAVNPAGTINDEARDAFAACIETNGSIGEDSQLSATLKRVVAQVNVIATDLAVPADGGKSAAEKAGVAFTQSNLVVKGMPTSLDLISGEVSGSADYTFAAAASDLLPTIASGYVLAGEEQLATVEFTAEGAVNDAAKRWAYTGDKAIANVPVQKNYRTNISGNIFTAEATINVTVDANWNTPDYEKDIEVVTDVTATNAALVEDKESSDPLSYVIETVKTDNTTIVVPAGMTSKDLTFTVAGFETGEAAAPVLTIQDEGATAAYAGDVTIVLPAGLDLGVVTVNLPAAHVTLTNGSATQVISTTGNGTLVIAKDFSAETIEVLKGNVELAGSVSTIVRGKGNVDELTYVTLVEGYNWKNQATDTAEGTKVVIKKEEEETSGDPSVDPGTSGSVVFDFTAATGTYAFENGVEIGSKTKAPITVTFAAGTNKNAPKYYTSGDAVRTYAGNTVTINGANISKVVFTFGASDGSNAILADSGELAENVWTGSATEVVFTIDGTSGNRRIAKMEVTYGEGTPVETSEDPVVLKEIVAEAGVKAVSVKVGESSEKVEVTVTDPAEGATVVLASKDETVATIAEGIVTGVAVGETEITATITAEGYNEKVISIPVTVAEATVEPQPAEVKVVTIAEFNAAEPLTAVEGAQKYQLTGLITEITNTTYGNMIIEDKTGSVVVYGLTATEQGLSSTSKANNDKSFSTLGLKAGDTVTMIGYRVDYNNAPEVLGAYYVSHVAGDAITELSFRTTATVEVGKTMDIHATNNVEAPVTYKSSNEAIVKVDANGVITGVAEGTATITATVAAVAGSYTAAEKVCEVTVKAASDTPALDPVIVNTFASEAVVTGEGAEQTATWTAGDITITAVKGNSTTDFRTTETNTTRFYSGWTITVTSAANTIASVEVTCDSASYATALVNATYTAGTAAASENVVTVSGISGASFSVALSAQVRASSFRVIYQ